MGPRPREHQIHRRRRWPGAHSGAQQHPGPGRADTAVGLRAWRVPGGCRAAPAGSVPSDLRAIDSFGRGTNTVGLEPCAGRPLEHETTTFIHDGTEATRLKKVISQIARSPLALEHLRVCFANEKSAYNCGQCDKCLRTMINLYVAGVLEQSSTFPHHIDPDLVAAIPTIPGRTRRDLPHRKPACPSGKEPRARATAGYLYQHE